MESETTLSLTITLSFNIKENLFRETQGIEEHVQNSVCLILIWADDGAIPWTVTLFSSVYSSYAEFLILIKTNYPVCN